MKKKILYSSLIILICVILSALIEIFIFNIKPLTSNDSSTSEISYTTKQNENNKIELELNLDQQYIRQLLIEYHTVEDVNYSIDYTYQGTYDIATNNVIDDIFDNSFTVSATNIDATVSQLSIFYDKENNTDIQIDKIFIDNAFHFNYFRAIFIFLSLLTLCSIYFFYKDGFRTEKIHIYFAVICSLLGLMIIFAQPAMNFFCWDDQTHFDRIVNFPIGTVEYNTGEYNMSDGNVANHTWPGSTDTFTEHRIRSSYLDTKDNSHYTGNNTGTFLIIHKIPYLPIATGYHIAKFIGLPFTACFQIGKIFNLLFYVLLMSYAIKTLYSGKRILAVIALLPSNIFLASEYSYDPAVLAGITIFIVYIINLLLDKSKNHKLDFKTAAIMIAAMTYACLAKAVYAPLMLLILLIPKEKFKNTKQARLVKTGFIAISLLLCSVLFLPTFDGVNVSDSRGGEVSAKDQAMLVISKPFDYVSVLNNTAVSEFGYKFFSSNTLINFSYAHSFSDHYNFYYIILFLLIFTFLTDNKKNQLTKKQRLYFLGITLFIILLIWSALYIDFTPVGLTTINGVQNRYFLPLLLPFLFCLQFPNIQNKINPKYYNLAIFLLLSITMIFATYQFILTPYNF